MRNLSGFKYNLYSPPQVDRIWGTWGSSYNIPKAILYLLKGDYIPTGTLWVKFLNINPAQGPDLGFILYGLGPQAPLSRSLRLSIAGER